MAETLNTHQEENPDANQEHDKAMLEKAEQLESNPNRPEWLPEKFKTAEELVASYQELEKKLGQGSEVSTGQEETITEEQRETIQEQENEVAQVMDKAGLDFNVFQEEYAEKYGKNKSIESDSIKRKERIKNIDVELENWRNLKTNSEKMISEGYAKESTKTALEKFRKGLDQQAKEKLAELQAKQAEAVKAKEANSIGTKKKDCGCEEKEGKKIGECEECKKKAEAAAQKKTVVRKKRTTKKK